ncbi:hypothetical protein [Mesorhizobium sp. M7A.F.Ca.MR.362.00.0.0]|uniref:hypothetical protein n=1 Tax=Mesorhizobium sp. M7A.F.Ca.MR.362.00.0.0 TaxID=2496779 RepID=UPI0019D43C07|nr:hypothetical protein [Mesorhizobium sp. M7A.F.Ca.MR.362.00.0.0]
MTSIQIDIKDGLSSSVAIKGPCVVATTANITLVGEQTIDGVAVVTDDRVLVKDQTTGADNGIYVADTGNWRRSKDFNKTKDIKAGTLVNVTSGTAGAGWWQVSTTGDITVGTTSIAFSQPVMPYDADLAAIAALTTTPYGRSLLTMSAATDVRNSIDAAPYVATRTALKALDTTKDTTAFLTEAGREGVFMWKAGNYSTQIATDTSEGVYVKATAIAAASGAWVRVYSRLTVEMFGASTSATATANTTAIQAAVNVAQLYTGYLFFPALYSINGSITVSNNVVLEGVSAFTSGITTTTGAAISLVPSTLILNNNTWYGIRYLSIISTDAGAHYGIEYASTGAEYLSNWEMVGCYLSGTSGGASWDSTGSTVGIFSCTIRRNWFNNGMVIKDGGDSITLLENTVNGNGIGIQVNTLKAGARQLVIRNNNVTTLSECIYLLNVTGAIVDQNWMETPSYLGSYTGGTGALLYAQACPNTRITRNTIQPLYAAMVGLGQTAANYSIRLNTSGAGSSISDNDIAIGAVGHIQIGAGVTNTLIDWDNKFDATAIITDAGTGTFGSGNTPGVFNQPVTFKTTAQFTSVAGAECTDAGAGNGPYWDIYRNSASPAVSDGIGGFLWYGNNASGSKINYGYITHTLLNVTAGAEAGQFNIARMLAGALVVAATFGTIASFTTGASFVGAVLPSTGATYSLGNTTQTWLNLFMATGSVINFNNGNYTITHTAGVLTFSGSVVLSSAGGSIGYVAGAGGAVAQATDKTTTVILNRPTGAITMQATALAAGAIVSFTLTNSVITADDVLILNHKAVGTPGGYSLNARCAAGSATIDVRNNTAGSLSEAIVIQFALVQGAIT